MPVLDYNLLIDRELAWGEIVTTDDALIWTFFNQTDEVIPMGFGVVQDGSTTKGVKLPTANTETIEGIAYYSNLFEKRDGYSVSAGGYYGYPKKYTMSVVRKGIIAVPVDKALPRGTASLQMRIGTSTTNTSAIKGTFTTGAAGTDAITLPYARVYRASSAPAANKLTTAWIDLRMPN